MESSTTTEQRKDLSGRDGGTTLWDHETNGLIFQSGDCCFNACTFTSDHYHCQACGISTTEVSQALAHIRTSPACRKDPLVNYAASSVAMATDPTNTLYNALYNGFSAQSSYPTAGFSGYSQIDSFQWHPGIPDKVTICSSQLSPCCSSNGATYIPVESQLCSPISDLYSKVTPIRDLVSLPAKSSGSAVDSPSWFAYNPQQIQKSTYKYTDQNPPPQINFILLDPSDQKHQDIGEASTSLPSNFCAKTDIVGKDVLKESYCSYTSQPLPGILSEDTLFSLNQQDDSLKQADVHQHQTPVSQIILSDFTSSNKGVPLAVGAPSTSRVETHFTREHFGHYISSCSNYPSSIGQENDNGESLETSHQPSSAASDSDESDIVVEDTGDDLGSQMTESEIFIEDIKCSLLQGVVSEEENQTVRTEVFQNKTGESDHHPRKETQQTIGEDPKILTGPQLKECLSYHALLKCMVCEKSVSDGDAGSVFVQMSTQMPLTTSSQTPVLTKLNEVVAIDETGLLDVNGKYMCQNCFNLVDTVDSLESKLELLKQGIAAMIKAGTKPLIVNHNQCLKLPEHMLGQHHSTLMNVPNMKSLSASVNIQELFQDSLVGDSTVGKPVIAQQQVTAHVTNDAEQKEYLLLSGGALSLGNSINKVNLSLSHHHSIDIVQAGQHETQNIAHQATCSLQKLPDMSSQPYHLSSTHPSSKHDGVATTSRIEPCQPSQKILSKEEVVPSYQPLECQKGPVSSPKGKEANEEEKCYKVSKNDLDMEIDYKENREVKVAGKKKLSFPSILSMGMEQVDEQKPHSSECIMENCHAMLRLERTMEENIRKESCTEHQLKFTCDLCHELFSSNELLQGHLSEFVKSESLCELCGQLYHNQLQLDDHMFDSHFVYQKHCKFCGTLFFHPCTFKLHTQSQCGKKSSVTSQSVQTSHENSSLKRGNASEIPPFVCKKCNQTFQMRSHLEHHIKATHVLKKALSKCDHCERTFIKPSDLQAHKRSHSNEKKFECSICGRRYKSISNLNHHAKSHEATKPFTCDICSQGFTRKDFYESHLNSHKDNKPFKCEKCLKSFSCKAYLQVHIKWHEDKIKKVTCPICKKSFSQRLNVHMRSHTGERPHPCEKCPKKFITGSALKKHVKRLHREDSPKSEYSVSDESDATLSDSDEPKSPLPS